MLISAFHGIDGGPVAWNGIKILPSRLPSDPYGAVMLAEHVRHEGADLAITLCDVWALDPGPLKSIPVAHWMPVDTTANRPDLPNGGLGEPDEVCLKASGAVPVAMSRHGETLLRKAGFDPLFVPHGLDPAFRQFAPERDAAREAMGVAGKFVVGMNAANKDNYRKGMFEQFEAFAGFHRDHPESVMLLHAAMNESLNLQRMANRRGIGDAVSFVEPYALLTGQVAMEHLVSWYGALDLYSACSLGEGFGIPPLEAQALGVPVVTTDCSASAEMCGAGWKVSGELFWNETHGETWTKPRISGIERVYRKAYALSRADDGRWGQLQAQGRQFAEPYHSATVLKEHWEPVLEELFRRLHPPVKLAEREPGGPAISVCFASRGRPESLKRTVERLLELAAAPEDIEVLVAADDDDEATCALGDLTPMGAEGGLPPQVTVYAGPRHGYTNLHVYLNSLAGKARGEWLMWWNDDFVMVTQGWDKIVRASRPAVLWPHANHVEHANIAPIWPRAWSDAMGHASPTTHMDTHLQRLGETLGRHDRIPVEIIHDRADVTGNHDDQTYAEGRKLLGPEGMVGEFSYAGVARDAAVIRELLRQEAAA